jgi:hypothetical protein
MKSDNASTVLSNPVSPSPLAPSNPDVCSPLTNAVVQLTDRDGNAYAILGRIRRAILESDHPELVQAFMEEATSGDYDHLLATCFKYVTVV